MLEKVISINQSAFISGRNIRDGLVAINEVVDFKKKDKIECFIFKVDFEKAYDSVNWNLLDYMMRRLGIGEKWRNWIKACVFNGNLSMLVNGNPTNEIKIQRGLKQGDLVAHFLFLLVAERLTSLV